MPSSHFLAILKNSLNVFSPKTRSHLSQSKFSLVIECPCVDEAFYPFVWTWNCQKKTWFMCFWILVTAEKNFHQTLGVCSVAFAHCCKTFNKYFPYKNTCCDFQSYLTIVQIVSAPFLSIEPLFSQKNDNQQRMMFGGLAKPLLLTSKCSPLNIAHFNSFLAGLNFLRLKKSNQLNNGKIRVQKRYKNEHW